MNLKIKQIVILFGTLILKEIYDITGYLLEK